MHVLQECFAGQDTVTVHVSVCGCWPWVAGIRG